MMLTKLEFSTQQENDEHVTNNVEYEETYAVEVKRFVKYDTEVDKGSPRRGKFQPWVSADQWAQHPAGEQGEVQAEPTEEARSVRHWGGQRFTQRRTYDTSSGPTNEYEETCAVKVIRFEEYYAKVDTKAT